jgi:chaperonin GroES
VSQALRDEWLALAHRDCQSGNNHKSQIIKTKEGRMKFRPLHDCVVVKRIEAEDTTAGGIIIPDSSKERPSEGEVTTVGPGGRDEAGKPIPIGSGQLTKLDGQELPITKESDIMGVLTDVPAAKKKAA